jgi:hypothetical protein
LRPSRIGERKSGADEASCLSRTLDSSGIDAEMPSLMLRAGKLLLHERGLTMNKSGWSRAYYCVAAAACLTIPLAAFVAEYGAAYLPEIVQRFNVDLPPISKLFLGFFPHVHYAVAASALVLIGILAVRRANAFSVMFSLIILVLCVAFHVLALWAIEMPLIHLAYVFMGRG